MPRTANGMHLQDRISDEVVRNLYEAAAGLIPWPQALGTLHREMNCSGVQLVAVDKADGRLVMSEQPTAEMLPANIDGTLDHVREYHRHDPTYGLCSNVANRRRYADLVVTGAGTAGGTLHIAGFWNIPGPVGYFKVTGALGGKQVAVLVPEA